VDIAKARASGNATTIVWAAYGPEAFARAALEKKPILIDGAAEWCHWCHVMDETTYRDPAIVALVRDKFIAVRVDVDARPDLQERWSDWGWPATIVLASDGRELGKLRGYLSTDRMMEVLTSLTSAASAASVSAVAIATEPELPIDALPWLRERVGRDLDNFYDEAEGGWGRGQKAPLGANVEVELARAAKGDLAAAARARFTLEKQRGVIDPVWGGVYQYSAASDWKAPHFEKLMVVQAAQIEAYARAATVLHERAFARDASEIARYLDEHLKAPSGAFFPNQDADVGAHDRAVAFVDGHLFFSKDAADRRALGAPWVDPHIYSRENGLAIAALCALFEATRDAGVLDRARRAADAVVASHVSATGEVVHDATTPSAQRYLADAAALARGLVRLHEATRDARYLASARAIVARLRSDFGDAKSAALFDATIDAGAAGAFATRTHGFAANVLAARAMTRLARVVGGAEGATLIAQAKALLAALSTPAAIDDQGRTIGELRLALDELLDL
jgi:uncharacterized protein YyaL (SSP411 family)